MSGVSVPYPTMSSAVALSCQPGMLLAVLFFHLHFNRFVTVNIWLMEKENVT